jgi:hypothetical protein
MTHAIFVGRGAVRVVRDWWVTIARHGATPDTSLDRRRPSMSKRARKRRARKGKAANHGRKPNA